MGIIVWLAVGYLGAFLFSIGMPRISEDKIPYVAFTLSGPLGFMLGMMTVIVNAK